MTRISKEPQERRRELLEVGIDLYFNQHKETMSIQEIVQGADVAIGLFYYYFDSKEEYMDEMLNYFIQKKVHVFMDVFDHENLSAEDKLEKLLTMLKHYAQTVADHRQNTAFQSLRHFQLTERVFQHMLPKVQAWIHQGYLEGSFSLPATSMTAGFLLNGVFALFQPEIPITDKHFQELEDLLIHLLKG